MHLEAFVVKHCYYCKDPPPDLLPTRSHCSRSTPRTSVDPAIVGVRGGFRRHTIPMAQIHMDAANAFSIK